MVALELLSAEQPIALVPVRYFPTASPDFSTWSTRLERIIGSAHAHRRHTLHNADHATETDAAWNWEVPWGRGPALAFDACVVWFFDTHLKGEAPPFPTNPEIYNVQRK